MAFGALATATGLAYLAKRKKDEEESEDILSHCKFNHYLLAR